MSGIPAEEYLAFELRLSGNEASANGSGAEPVERLARLQDELVGRLSAEPQVRAVAFADALPRMDHRSRVVEVDGAPPLGEGGRGRWVRVARIDADFFQQLGAPILLGRDFDRADTEVEVRPVIVNSLFVEELLAGDEPIGRRVRFPTSREGADAPWHEIVGVVEHLGVNTVSRNGDPGVYFVAPRGGIHPVQVGIRVGPNPLGYAPRLREIVAEVDPTAIVGTPVPLGRVQQGDWYLSIGITAGIVLLVGVLVVLAASGIHAIMAFSVSERTREIGIRSALGAGRHALLRTILRRALVQLGAGALLGVPLAAWFLLQFQDSAVDARATLSSVALADSCLDLPSCRSSGCPPVSRPPAGR